MLVEQDVVVVELACRLLSTIAVDTGGQSQIASDGGIERLVIALTDHVSSASVVALACGTLACVASLPLVRSSMLTPALLTALCGAMDGHGGDVVVQRRCVSLMRALGGSVSARGALARAECVPRLLRAIARCESDEEVALMGVTLLLAFWSDKGKVD